MAQAGTKQIYIWNRTVGKAFRISQGFQNATTTCVFTPAGHLPEIINAPDVIIPGEGMPTPSYVGLSRKHRGLCIEMAYKPGVMNLLGVVRSCSEGTTADGPEVLLRQALDQSRLWIGKEAPQSVMRQAV